MKMKRLPMAVMAVLMLSLWSCELFNGSNEDRRDSIAQPIDTTAIAEASDEIVVKGEAVDGSRRNIYVQVGDSTYSFELSPGVNVQWQIGDTLTVRYKPTEEGDSVIEVTNANA